ncbi:Serine proteinase-like protein 2 [Operophtera brumata]|uniref:Serine proteinase-like protein 2 n=1 Tax=Operophtera brumata TaxID=104452 RepID=A0A0L7LI08_OPEBR|nr:Serine proteinase-like protein 2 [Operophtera brumata]
MPIPWAAGVNQTNLEKLQSCLVFADGSMRDESCDNAHPYLCFAELSACVDESHFQNQSLVNDIALLRLEKPLQLTEHINALCLPTADESFEGAKNCRYAVILKKVELDMVPHDRCQALLQRTRLGPYFQLHRSFVCAGGDGKDTCQGDGGAPLACPIGDERYKLGGLVAWGIGCRTIDVPGVYTNVAAFRPWVDAKMRDWGFGTDAYTI